MNPSCQLMRFAASALIIVPALMATSAQAPAPAEPAEARAIAYLAREVPRWRQEHACYSCHNNGDAARALIVGLQRRHAVRPAIDDTLTWLADPARWDSNPGGEGGGDDKRLARIQFASATVTASAASLVTQPAVDAAADIVAKDQREDGSWRLDSSTSLGSPATYGTPLATAFALRVLSQSRASSRSEAIARGSAWLRRVEPANVPDAVAIILGLGNAERRSRAATAGAGLHQACARARRWLGRVRDDRFGTVRHGDCLARAEGARDPSEPRRERVLGDRTASRDRSRP